MRTPPEAEKAAARDYASWDLTERQLCDIELLLNGAFSPLDGFLNRDDYDAVVSDMRLTSGVLWPMPITLDVTRRLRRRTQVRRQDRAARSRGRDPRHARSWRHLDARTRPAEAEGVFGTTDEKHPAVHFLNNIAQPGLRRRQAEGHRGADPLRLQAPARQPGRSADALQEARLAQGCCVPDPQPDAPRAPGDLRCAPPARSKPTC